MQKKITIVFFLFLLVSPSLGWIAGFRTELLENRVLAKMPEVTGLKLMESKFYFDLGKFHDDRFPYRGWLIKAKNSIDFNIFKTSPSTRVHIGKRGWLFHAPSLRDYLKDGCQDREMMRNLAKKLNELERNLEISGRRLIFLVAPNKATIYPEYLRIKRSENDCMKSRYDLLLEALEEFPVKGFVRLDNLLIKGKTDYQVYEKTGTHWNIHGAIIASKAILRKLTPEWEEYMPKVEIVMISQYKDLSNMLKMFGSWGAEQVPSLDSMAPNFNVTELETPREHAPPNLTITAQPKGNRQLLPKTLMYRDSFMTTLLDVIKGSFEQIEALWTFNVQTIEEIDADKLNNAEILFIEIVERNLALLNIDINNVAPLN